MTTEHKQPRRFTSESEVRRMLQAALYERKLHSDDCALWDYDGPNGCEACMRHDAKVRGLRERLQRGHRREQA